MLSSFLRVINQQKRENQYYERGDKSSLTTNIRYVHSNTKRSGGKECKELHLGEGRARSADDGGGCPIKGKWNVADDDDNEMSLNSAPIRMLTSSAKLAPIL